MFLVVTNITLAKRKKYDGELSNKVDGFHLINSDLDLFCMKSRIGIQYFSGQSRAFFTRVGSAGQSGHDDGTSLIYTVEPLRPVEVEDAVEGGRVPVKVVLVVL